LSISTESKRDAYKGVVLVLAVAAFVSAVSAAVAGALLADGALLDAGATVWLFTGTLVAVVVAQMERKRTAEPPPLSTGTPPPETAQPPSDTARSTPPGEEPPVASPAPVPAARDAEASMAWAGQPIGAVRFVTAVLGILAIGADLAMNPGSPPPGPVAAVVGAGACLLAAGLFVMIARYLGDVDALDLPEAPGLARFARVLVWILVLAAFSVGLTWGNQQQLLYAVRFVILLVAGLVCYGLCSRPPEGAPSIVPLDFPVLGVLGSRLNVLASILDAGERQLGIDLRSTWALTVVRRSIEPLGIGVLLLGWISTSFTRVASFEEGRLERLGVATGGPLPPGLHVHLPWPVDRVFLVPTLRVQSLAVGHEGAESTGPEDVLWARQHAANEYTLLLGNGRELITVDAAVQYRIRDTQAWLYHWQNPEQALSALAYRAVMRSTVDRTLADALSQNVELLTAQMRQTVQRDADALGLGVEVVDFTIGGMHPPVPVAPDYQAVVSAELRKSTASVTAQVYRNQTVPAAEAEALGTENLARADGKTLRGKAAGEAWAFRALESEYRAAPADYFFRRRMEALETGLRGQSYTVVDVRIQRDGGELWLTP